jgi:hypothetical protein
MILGAELVTLKVAFSLRADFAPQPRLSKKAKETAVKNIRIATSIVEHLTFSDLAGRMLLSQTDLSVPVAAIIE